MHKLVGIDFDVLQIAAALIIDLKRQLLLAIILIEHKNIRFQKFTLDSVQIGSTSTNIDDHVVVIAAAVIMDL